MSRYFKKNTIENFFHKYLKIHTTEFLVFIICLKKVFKYLLEY